MDVTDVIILVVIVIAGSVLALLVNWLPKRPSWLKPTSYVATFIITVGVLVFFTALKDRLQSSGSSGAGDSPAASVSSTTTRSSETIPPTTTVPTTTTSVEPPPNETEGSVKYLADLEPVSGAFSTGVSTIGGNTVDCNKSLLFSLNTFSSHKSAVFNIEPNWTKFTVSLGLDQNVEDGVVAHFQIYLDGTPINAGYKLGRLALKQVTIGVTGKSRIELATDGVENGGGVGHVGNATWCDARFTK